MSGSTSASAVLVTYSAPAPFLASQWDALRAGLQKQLPLRGVHWKSTNGGVRTINELVLNLVPFDSIREPAQSLVPANLLARPLLNIYFVSCEDAETYKGTVRKQLKEWHAQAISRKNQDWLIVHVVRADTKGAQAGFFQRGTVIDKLRADFNTEKRDRVVPLAWPIASTNLTAWAELLSKVKDGVLGSFDIAISGREDEVRRSESQRLMPGWNFCSFFLLKESLALSYESMGLISDALAAYQQLENTFQIVLREKNLSWFGMLIVPSPRDDAAPLLSLERKAYTDLILANTVSVFDLRIYMLARQAALLARYGKLSDICTKANRFLVSFGRTLWEAENILPAHFIEAWTYASALSVVDQVDLWCSELGEPGLDGAPLNNFNAAKAELIELARHQLDILGVSAGHLPSRAPFTMSISPERPRPNAVDKRASRTISQPALVACFNDAEAFYELYNALTNKAIDLYARAGRRKFALKLHGSLAALDVHRGLREPAFQTYSSLPAHYAPYRWRSLEAYMLNQALSLHTDLPASKDAQWLGLALSFLKAFVGGLGKDLLMTEEDARVYVGKIVDSFKEAAGSLESDLTQPDHPALVVQVKSLQSRLADDEDGCYLDVVVENHLPCALPTTDISISLNGPDGQDLTFHSPLDQLTPGANSISLFCATSSWGAYTLDTTDVRLERLHFVYDHRPDAKAKSASRVRRALPVLVHLARDPHALDVRVRRPRIITIGEAPDMLLTLTSGRNDVARVKLTLSSPTGVALHCQNARFENEESAFSLETSDDSITLVDIPKETVLNILVPHAEAAKHPVVHINVAVSYSTAGHPDISRSLALGTRIPTNLPLRVNVEDFFRGTRLFTKFTLSTTTSQFIRLVSAELQRADGRAVPGARPRSKGIVTITPARPANALFQLERADAPAHDEGELRLCIRYRMLRDEVEALLEDTIEEHVDAPHRADVLARLVEKLESDPTWVATYTVTGELQVPGVNKAEEEEEGIGAVLETLRQSRTPSLERGLWRELRMPVDVPQMNILAAARLDLQASAYPPSKGDAPPPIYAGQPVRALLRVHTTLCWSNTSSSPTSPAPTTTHRLRFDVAEHPRDWLVSGRVRGDFAAQDGGAFEATLTLVPLRAGALPLPRVRVAPLEGDAQGKPSCETYQAHGAEVVQVLPRGGRSTFLLDMGDGVA
ncbi:hypothetical protein PENSPDRAFT_628128 [Peniophora sp. CONT]|nr:hypothetical protein PENSPDRAFT_628128 [Peniophora sp. CONT]